jgi:hypothetical protein
MAVERADSAGLTLDRMAPVAGAFINGQNPTDYYSGIVFNVGNAAQTSLQATLEAIGRTSQIDLFDYLK